MTSLLLTLFAFSPLAQAQDGPCKKSHYENPSLVQVFPLQNGSKLYLCGEGSLDQGFGELLLEKPGGPIRETSLSIGGVKEVADPFATDMARIRPAPDGLSVTELIPIAINEYVPAFKKRIRCKDTCVELKKTRCVFRKLKKGGDAKDTALVLRAARENGPIPSDNQLMEAYRSALAGNKAAISALLSKKFRRRMDAKADENSDSPDGYPHTQIAGILEKLQELRCW